MMNAKFQDFICDVIDRGQIRYGDVRRLQRDYLPGGITNREELELLISLNAKLVAADKSWAQWLAAAVAEFVIEREEHGRPGKEAAGERVERLLASSTTSLGRRIGRQVRRELRRRHGIDATSSQESHQERTDGRELEQPFQHPAPKNDRRKCSPRTVKLRRAAGYEAVSGMVTSSAAQHWYWGSNLSAVEWSHSMNFQSATVSLVLAPCR